MDQPPRRAPGRARREDTDAHEHHPGPDADQHDAGADRPSEHHVNAEQHPNRAAEEDEAADDSDSTAADPVHARPGADPADPDLDLDSADPDPADPDPTTAALERGR